MAVLAEITPGWLFAGLVTSVVGVGLLMYAKRERRWPQLLAGWALLIYPFFVSSALLIYGIAAGVILLLVWGVRAGY